LILWFSLFFPLLYPQIRVNTVFLNADCLILSVTKVPYLCCYKNCFGCGICGISPSCSSMLYQSQPGPCCDGYECCNQCCDTCQDCSSSSTDGSSCSSYSCNCRCCLSTPDQACEIVCPTCWKVIVDLQYTCTEDNPCCEQLDPQQATTEQDCGTSESCADQYIQKPYLVVNQSTLCFFDPTNCGSVAFEKGYTWWYWLLWSFPTVVLLVLMNYWTFHGLNVWFDSWMKALIGYLLIWWVILFPLIFLVPLAEATKIDAVPTNAKTGILALAFTLMAIALGAMGFLYYRERGGNLAEIFHKFENPRSTSEVNLTEPR